MYDQQSLDVILKMKVHGFGAYLQREWFDHGHLNMLFAKGEMPDADFLKEKYDGAYAQKFEFDEVYLRKLPAAPVNPLQQEQDTWRKLSQKWSTFLDGLAQLIQEYDAEKNRIPAVMNEWWQLLQEWNAISNSYKPKLEEAYAFLSRKGIKTLTTSDL